MHATRAAVEEGIVPGGGVALLRASLDLAKVKTSVSEQVGVDIMKRALEGPIRQICSNAGVEASIVVQKFLKARMILDMMLVRMNTLICSKLELLIQLR